MGGLPQAFHMAPGGCLAVKSYGPSPRGFGERVVKGQPEVSDLTEDRDNRFSVSGIPDVTGHHGGAENKMGDPGWLCHPQGWKEERAGR